MECLDHHGQSTTTIFPSCTSVSLALFHHSGASPHCPPGDFQQPLSADLSAPTFCGLILCIIPCHISLLNSPWKESDVWPFYSTACQSLLLYLQSLTFPLYARYLPPWISQGALVACHMPRGKWAGCSLCTEETRVWEHFFGFALFFNLTPAKNVLLDMRSKVQLLTQTEELLQSKPKPTLTTWVCFIFF